MKLIKKNEKWILKHLDNNLIVGPFNTKEQAIKFHQLYLNNFILVIG